MLIANLVERRKHAFAELRALFQHLLNEIDGCVGETRQIGEPSDVEYVFQVGLRDVEQSGRLISSLREIRGITLASLVLRDELAEV